MRAAARTRARDEAAIQQRAVRARMTELAELDMVAAQRDRMQRQAEQKALIPDKCYGSQAGQQATDLALN